MLKIIKETPKTVVLELDGKRRRRCKTTLARKKKELEYFLGKGLDSFKNCMKEISDYLKNLPDSEIADGGDYITIVTKTEGGLNEEMD